MFTAFYAMIPKWLLIALVVGLGLSTCAERTQKQNLQVKYSNYTAVVAQRDEAQEKIALAAEETERAREVKRFQTAQEITNDTATEKSHTAQSVVADSGARRLFTNTVAEITAVNNTGSCDPAAVSRTEQITAALGDGLVAGDSLAQGLAEQVEALSTQVRGLQRAYNSLVQSVAQWLPSDILMALLQE